MSAEAAEACLMYVLLPAWVLAGAADWLCHYRVRIERSTGWRELLIHLALLLEAGIPVILGLTLEIDGGVLLVMLFCFAAHEVTGYWDVRYATAVRGLAAIEQKVHDYLIAVPFAALVLVAVMHWPAALSLLGTGPVSFEAAFRPKQDALPASYVVGILVLIGLFNGLPYVQELARGLRAAKRRREISGPPPQHSA